MNTSHSPADLSLPAPDAAAARHSEALTEHIRGLIGQSNGWISFARYMDLALYAPGLGYYSSGARKFGEDGDFVTAPEISPLFTRCLATQIEQVLTALGGGDVLEIGGGTGVMAADLLMALDAQNALPNQYSILEISADLKDRQRATLQQRCPALASCVQWLDRPPSSAFNGVVVGNEVLDALSVECFQIGGDSVLARGVACKHDGLVWANKPADTALTGAVRGIEAHLQRRLPDDYRGECLMNLPAWLQAVTASLEAGAVFFIDYGLPASQLYLPERSDGTLACYHRHRFHDDPFASPGLTDITAWVDFSAVARAAEQAGLTPAGFTTQAHFLFACDLEKHLQMAFEKCSSTAAQMQLAGQVRRLTMPGEMGERFKVVGLARKFPQPLRGFGLRDLTL